jgi:heme/copper-type cytochrome/quinol oxidase subunit 4
MIKLTILFSMISMNLTMVNSIWAMEKLNYLQMKGDVK